MNELKPLIDAIQAMGAAGGVLMTILYLRSDSERRDKDKLLLAVTRECVEATKSATAAIDMLRVTLGTKAPPGSV